MPLIRKPKDPPPDSTSQIAGVLSALTSPEPDERWAAARAAAGVAGGANALASAVLTETDPRVREAMFTSLARIGTPESAHRLLQLLRSDEAQLRTGATDALRMMPTVVRDLLPEWLRDPDVDVRILSCELARSLPNEEATALLCAVLAGEQQVNVCAAAIEVLAEVGSPAALPILAECARRFSSAPFLGFAIAIATQRINAQSASNRE